MGNIKAGSIGAASGIAAMRIADTFKEEVGYGLHKTIDGLAILGNGAGTALAEYGLYGLGGAAGLGCMGAGYLAAKRLAPVAFNFSQSHTYKSHGANVKQELLDEYGDHDYLVPAIEGLPDKELGKVDIEMRELARKNSQDSPELVDIVREIRPSLANQLDLL